MDRYYRMLGIPNNSSKESIKKSYHEKIKALHPDKIHGTPLEATATFFTAEINEAYNILMSQFKEENTSSDQSNQENIIEKDIFIEGIGLLKYTLSNNINVIINTTSSRSRCTFPDNANEIQWSINPNLSVNVKNTMNEYNMNYSMTIYFSGAVEKIVINKRTGDNWYSAFYEINTSYHEEKETTHNYNTGYKPYYSKQKSLTGMVIKTILAITAFILICQYFNNPNPKINPIQVRTQNTRAVQVFATVTPDWLNVRSTPSSVNNNNIIEAIRINTRVEIIDRSNNGWVRIRYNNGKTGYVYGHYLK